MANGERMLLASKLVIMLEKRFRNRTMIHYDDLMAAIADVPTVDAVEVVRCRDCRHFTEGMAVGMCKRVPDKPLLPVVYNHFCSYGERREGE